MAFFDEQRSAQLTHLLIVGARDIKDALGDKLPIAIMSLGKGVYCTLVQNKQESGRKQCG